MGNNVRIRSGLGLGLGGFASESGEVVQMQVPGEEDTKDGAFPSHPIPSDPIRSHSIRSDPIRSDSIRFYYPRDGCCYCALLKMYFFTFSSLKSIVSVHCWNGESG